MAYEEFTGELDKEPHGFAEFTGQLDKPEPSLIDKVGDAMNFVRDYAQSFVPPPQSGKSVLEGKQITPPAGMTDDVDVDANRFARDRSKSPESVMFRKSNAADKAEKLTTLGKKVLKEAPQTLYNDADEQASDIRESDERKQFAESNPHIGAVASGAASATAGAINFIPAAAQAAKEGLISVVNFFNNATVNPVIEAAGGTPLHMADDALGGRIGDAPFVEGLKQQAADYMPEVGRKSLVDTYGTPEFLPSLTAKLSAQAPQFAQQLVALFVPALQAPFIASMGASATGNAYSEGDAGAISVAKGALEAGSEYLPFAAAHKLGTMAARLPLSLQNKFLAETGRRLFEAGGKLTAAHLVEGAEEVASQFGQNVLDRYVAGKDTKLSEGVVDAGAVGAIAGGAMSVKNVYNSLAGNTKPVTAADILAGEIDRGVNGLTTDQSVTDWQARQALNANGGIDPRLTSITTREKAAVQIGTASTIGEAAAAFTEATHTDTPSVTDLVAQAGLSNGTDNTLSSVPAEPAQVGGIDPSAGLGVGDSNVAQPAIDPNGGAAGAGAGGSQSAQGAASDAVVPSIPAFKYTINPSGTVEVHGDPKEVRAVLQGHRGMQTANGVTYGVSRAQEVISKLEQAHGMSFPNAATAVAHAQQLGVADQVEPMNTGESTVLAPAAQKETVGDLRTQSVAVSNLAEAVTRGGRDGSTIEPARPVPVSAENSDRAGQADGLISLVGRVTQTAFGFKPIAVTGLDGMFGAAHGGNVFINRDTVAAEHPKHSLPALVIATIGHEATHATLEKSQDQDDKTAYANFVTVANQYMRQGVVADRQKQEESTEDYAHKEIIADINGAMWLDHQFWGKLYDIDGGSTMRRIAYRFMQAATKFITVAKGSRLDAGRFVTNVEAVREAAAKVWADRAGRKGKPMSRTQAKGELESPSFSRRERMDDFDKEQGDPREYDDLGGFNLDRSSTKIDAEDEALLSQPNEEEANRPFTDADMAALQSELDRTQGSPATSITPQTSTAPAATAKSPRDVTLKDLEEHGLFPERALPFGEATDVGDDVELSIPSGHSNTFYDITKVRDGTYGLSAPGTWIDDGLTRDGAIDFVKRMIGRNIVMARGYDLLSAYRKKKVRQIAKVWKEISKQDVVFKFPRYEGNSPKLEDIINDMGAFKGYSFEIKNGALHPQKILFRNAQGDSFETSIAMLGGNSFQVCTLGLKGSNLGTEVYAVLGEWAAMNHLQFHADQTLSGINTYRRTEQAASFALKYWDANVLLTGTQNRVYGFEKDGAGEANDRNIVRLLLAGMRNAVEAVPQIRNYTYDYTADKFLDARGQDAESKITEFLNDKQVRAFGVGRSTLARALITSEIVRGNLTADKVGTFDKSVAYSMMDAELDKPQSESWGDQDGGLKPELKKFMGKSVLMMEDGLPVVMYHGTAADITGFRAKQAGAVFLTYSPRFADDFAGLSHDWMKKNFPEFLSKEQIAQARENAVKEVMADKSMPMSERSFIKLKMMESYPQGAAKDYFEKHVAEMLPTGPNIMPVIARAEHPFDFKNKAHVTDLMYTLKDRDVGYDENEQTLSINLIKDGGAEMQATADEIEMSIRSGAWEFIESPQVQAAIKELGHDSFFVYENGQRNIAIYDPKAIKSLFNTGAYGTRAVTIEEAAGRGLSVEEANEAQAAGDLSFSKVDYTPEQKKAALAKKFERMRKFHGDLPTLLQRITRDAKAGKEEAAILQLIAKTGFRIGGKVDLVEGKQAFGASTLKPEHVNIKGANVTFDFIGKAGVRQRHTVSDLELSRMLKSRLNQDRLFGKADRAVRRYLDSIIDGKDYKVHDFRTWNATAAAQSVVDDLPLPINEAEYRAGVELAGSVAATKIGDQLGVTLEHYVDPQIFAAWRKSAGISDEAGVQAGIGEGEGQVAAASDNEAEDGVDGQDSEEGLSYSKVLDEQIHDKAASAAILNGPPVAELVSLDAPTGGFAAIVDWASSIFKRQGGVAFRAGIGEVLLDARSAKSSLAHGGANKYKKIAFAAVKDVIERGALISMSTDGAEDSFYLSAPVLIDGVTNIETVLVHRDTNTKRMYLHSVATKEYLLNHRVSSVGTEVPKRSGSTDSGDVGIVIQSLLNFNDGLSYSKIIVGDTGRQYTPEQLRGMDAYGFRTDKVTLKDKLKELRRDFGKKMAQGLADQFAPVKEFDEHAYTLMRLSKGSSGAFEAILHGGKLKLTDDVYDFDSDNRGGVIKSLLIPLQGEHHDFLRWIAANRSERLAAEGRENLASAQDIADVKSLSSGTTNFDYTLQHGPNAGQVTRNRQEIYDDSLKTFNEFNRNIMDLAEQSGLIDPEARAIWEHEFYVPFYRMTDDGANVAQVKSGVVRQQAFKELKGGKNKLNADLLDNTLMNWAHLLDASAKNRAAKATMVAAQDMGIAIEANESTARNMQKSLGAKSQVVWFMDEGKQRFFVVDDQYVLTAINGLAFAGFRNPIMNAMSFFKHALTVGVTASPFFKVRNLIRDSVQAISVSNLSANPISNVARGWGLTQGESDSHFRNLASGATIHFGTMYEGSEARRVQALVNKGVHKSSILNSQHALRRFYSRMIEPAITAYNEIGNRGEEINRASLYDQLVKQGVSHADAALQARDLMDFSMQGSFNTVRFLTQVVPFMNARIQGMYKLGRGAKENPARFAAVLGAVSLASLALLAAYHDDDDWKKREEWDRNNFWWFKFGGTAFRIPKPFEIGAIATLAERGAEWMFDKEMTGERFAKQVMTLLEDNLSMNPVPQAVKPLLDVYSNKDSFSGRAIETPSMERIVSKEMYTKDTSMTSRGVSRAIGGALSPVQVEHLVRGYFGWLGAFVVGGADVIARPATGQPDKPEPDYWKVATGGMVADVGSGQSRYVSQMYEQAKELEKVMGTLKEMQKQGRSAEASEWAKEHQKELNDYGKVEEAKRGVSEINKEIRRIERDKLMSRSDKRVAIEKLKLTQHRIAKTLAPH